MVYSFLLETSSNPLKSVINHPPKTGTTLTLLSVSQWDRSRSHYEIDLEQNQEAQSAFSSSRESRTLF